MADALYRLASRLDRLERNIKALGTPQLASSSVEQGGAIDVNDETGATVMQMGGQFDGSFVASTLTGPTPPIASTPILEPAPGGVIVRWDGTFTDADVAPMDFARTEVHASTEEGFSALSAATLRDTMETARGNEAFISLPAGVLHYFKFVVRSLAGKAGPASEEASETPAVIGVDQETLDAIDASVQAAQDAVDAVELEVDGIPAQIATAKGEAITSAAATAQAKADAAEQAAIDAAALTAQVKASAAQSAATAAAATDATSKATTAKSEAIAAAATTAQLKADGAEQAAIDAAAITAQAKADAAEAAAVAAAALTAQAKADAAKNAAIAAAASDAQDKADLAEAAAINAAATDATSKANTAQTNAINSAATTAQTKADAAKNAAIAAAAITAQAKADTAKAEALTAAATTAQEKADAAAATAQAAAISAAATTAQAKADAAQAAALASAKTYADTKKAEAISAAATDATTKASNAQTAAINAAAITAQAKADTAKAEALTAAATTAQQKADAAAATAKAEAITAAAATAQAKADAAQAAAIAAAATDATTKATNAQNAAALASVPKVITVGAMKSFIQPFGLTLSGQSLPGSIVIDTPITFSSYMSTFKITGYNYVNGASEIDLTLAAYIYSVGPTFLQMSQTNAGSANVTARFARKMSTGKASIILDHADGVWRYPKIVVERADVGQTLPPDSFGTGWVGTLTEDLTDYDLITTPIRRDINDTNALTQAWRTTGQTTIDGGKITADSVTAGQIAANAITATEILAGAVVAGKLATDSVVAGNIKAGEVTAGKLAADSIVASNLQANSVIAGKVATDAILANNIKAGEVTAGKLAANSVVATNIVTDGILARHIKAGEITAAKMVAGTITAASGIIGSIDAAKITVGTIKASQLAADAIDGKTITGATIRTAAAGQRWTIDSTIVNMILGYTGVAGETNPGSIGINADGTSVMTNIYSPLANGGAATLQLSSPRPGYESDGAQASLFANGASGIIVNEDSLQFQSPSGDFKFMSNDYDYDLADLPRGTMGMEGRTTTQGVGNGGAGITTIAMVGPIQFKAGRRYALTFLGSVQSTVANDRIAMYVNTGNTRIAVSNFQVATTANTSVTAAFEIPYAPTTDIYEYVYVDAFRSAGTGACSMFANASGQTQYIKVTDEGRA